jgi:hypothetical protein
MKLERKKLHKMIKKREWEKNTKLRDKNFQLQGLIKLKNSFNKKKFKNEEQIEKKNWLKDKIEKQSTKVSSTKLET